MPVTGGAPLDHDDDGELLASARLGFVPQGQTRVAVAVSGGGDSVALLHLLHRVAAQAGWVLCAVTVDHALRAGSAGEAAAVGRLCAGLGLAHATLKWDHGDPGGNLMDEARKARLRLISHWAASEGISQVALGHTADDAAETFLMGLSRASGLDGLVGLRKVWQEAGIEWSRPLLRHHRAELRGYLRRHGLPWVDDPTNEDDRFARTRARRALVALRPLGITVEGLSTTINHLVSARQALRDVRADFVAGHVSEIAGALDIGLTAFAGLPFDLRRRVLVDALAWMSAAPHPPRMHEQVVLVTKVSAGRDTTLRGCRFRCLPDRIRICREPKAVAKLITATPALWDDRWRVEGPHQPGLEVRSLGLVGLKACKNWRSTGIARDALLVSPGIWRGDALIAAPLAGAPNGWTARIPASFSRFIVSH